MIREKDSYRLTSGRKIYSNHGILGLAPDDDMLFEGYDGTADPWGSPEHAPLTPAEKEEIAYFMIDRWRQWGKLPPRGREDDLMTWIFLSNVKALAAHGGKVVRDIIHQRATFAEEVMARAIAEKIGITIPPRSEP